MYVGKQLAKIHIGKKALGFSEKEYRKFLKDFTGKMSSKNMTVAERAVVIHKMTELGAFECNKPLTGQQRACVAKWYKLRTLGAVNSKDKSSLNRYCKKHFGKWNVADLTPKETNILLGHLQGWIDKVEHTVKRHDDVIQ